MVTTISAQKKKEKVVPPSKPIISEIVLSVMVDTALAAAPLYSNGMIYSVGKSGIISCIDTTGIVKWKYATESKIAAQPILADDMLAVGTSDSDLITIDIKNGRGFQSIGLDDSISTNLISFDYAGDKELMMPKYLDSKAAIVFGTKNGQIKCLDLETLQEYWSYSIMKGKITSQPLYTNNKIFFSSHDGFLNCIDSRNGLLLWRWKETAETDFSSSQFITDGKRIYLVSSDNFLYSIDILLGKLIWKAKDIKALPSIGISVDKKKLLVKTLENRFLILDSETGKKLKELKLSEPFDLDSTTPIDSDNKIIFTNNKKILLIDEKFNEHLILETERAAFSSILQIDQNKFLAATKDGFAIVFKLRQS